MTKQEIYKILISVHKAEGQGLSGIVTIGEPSIKESLNELINEGLCVCENTGGSLGHPDSNKFYMPTKGYNVWRDDNPVGRLICVRQYLGIFDENDDPFKTKNSDFAESGRYYDWYKEWVDRNKEALEEMKNLSEEYPGNK